MSADAIMAALEKWAKTPEGQKALRNGQKQMVKEGNFQGAGLHDPEWYAMQMMTILSQEFAADGYPQFADYLYWYTGGYNDASGGYMVTVDFFPEMISRPSLYPVDKNGMPTKYADGVDNIIALLNKGYHAQDYVYGEWPTGSGRRIRSMKDRAGLWFIQNAVEKFNARFGKEAVVDFGDVYGWRL